MEPIDLRAFRTKALIIGIAALLMVVTAATL